MRKETESLRKKRRFGERVNLEAILFILFLLVCWGLVTSAFKIPSYKFPSPIRVATTFVRLMGKGVLLENIWASVSLLVYSSAVGAVLAVPLGLSIALNKYVAGFFLPIVTFFQSIAGVAWVPLAIVWFGYGPITVTFVVANSIFFIVLFNTVTGVATINRSFIDSVRTLGGTSFHVMVHVILPGALINILAGLRFGLAFGWRALVAAEMISSSKGLGFMTLQAADYFQSSTIVVGIIVIGLLWLAMDRLILVPIERRTVGKWGMIRER